MIIQIALNNRTDDHDNNDDIIFVISLVPPCFGSRGEVVVRPSPARESGSCLGGVDPSRPSAISYGV